MRPQTIYRLIQTALEAPTDLNRRGVLADALVESGDPRGEFMSLQLRRLEAGGQKATRRESALLKAHGTRWLGRLSKYLTSPTFEAGFVCAATLNETPFVAQDALWPEWSSLTSLTTGIKVNAVPLLSRAKLLSLQVVHGLSIDALVELTRLAGVLPYRALELRWVPFASDAAPLAKLHAKLPRLASLTVSVPYSSMGFLGPGMADLAPLVGSKLFAGLRDFSVDLESEEELALLIERLAGSKLEKLQCRVEGAGAAVVVDFTAKRIDAPGELEELEAPRGFEVVLAGVSKSVQRRQAQWAELDLVHALEEAGESDLAWRLLFKQKLTKQHQAVVEALKSGACTPTTIEAWKAAQVKPASKRRSTRA